MKPHEDARHEGCHGIQARSSAIHAVFAVLISIAFGFLSRRRPIDRVKYIVWSLFLFLLIGVGIGWAMYPFSR